MRLIFIKIRKIISFMMTILFLCSFAFLTSFAEEAEMPYVILGGNTLFVEYTNEPLTYIYEENEGGEFDVVERDLNIVQIGDIPILCIPDVELAFKIYANKTVMIKEIINGKLYKRMYYIPNDESFVSRFIYQTSSSGKVCYYIPELSSALLFAHPISTGQCGGILYDATVIDMSEELYSISSDKVPNVVGTIINQNQYGIVMNYDEDRIDLSGYKRIQIARKDEVHLGKAYIYTDYGKGLDFYEVEVISLVGEPPESLALERIYEASTENDPIIGNEFYISFTDERFVEDGITDSVPGMSGSPIIQDDKLIGMNGYSDSLGGICIYACSSYEEVTRQLDDKSAPFSGGLYSSSLNPLVILGDTCGIFYMKDIGTYITKIEGESYGLEVGDKVIAIDDSMILVGLDLTDTIKRKHEFGINEVKLTIVRNQKIIDIYLSKDQNPILKNFNYNYMKSGYISMVDPITYRYAIGAFKNVIGTKNPFSGIVWEGFLDIDSSTVETTSSKNVIATITNSGCQGYGFIEPFNYREERLIEVASRDEVQNGMAAIYIFNPEDKDNFYRLYITIEKKGNYIQISLNDESFVESFEEVNISGLPIIQNGRIVGVYATMDEDKTQGKAYYAIDVYNEMMNISY